MNRATLRRTCLVVAALLALAGLLASTGTAAAETGPHDPGDEYVSGYDGAGAVSLTSTHPGEGCITHRAILVIHTDDPLDGNAAQRADSVSSTWRSQTAGARLGAAFVP